MLDPKAFPLRRKHNFRVGFAGSESHVYDLLSVIDEMIELKKNILLISMSLDFLSILGMNISKK